MILALATLLLTLHGSPDRRATPQETPPPAPDAAGAGPTDDDAGWRLVEGIAVQAGDDVVTLRELDQAQRDEMEAREISSEEERSALTWGLIELMATARLEPQAGEDLGFDVDLIRQHVHFTIDEERRQAGAVGFSQQLESTGKSIEDYQDTTADGQFRDLWQRKVMGYPTLPGERPTVDRFVRPGELKGIYRTVQDQLNPPTVQLQAIIAPVAAWGSAELAVTGFEDIRARALAGEDFDALEREFNAEGRDDHGIAPPMPATRIPIAELREFALTAREGEIGPVLTVERDGSTFVLLARVRAREEPTTGFFGEREVQSDLRQRLDQLRNNNLLGSERSRLLQRSYSWIHPALGRLRAAAEASRRARAQG